MFEKIIEMKNKKSEVVAEMRGILNRAIAEGRGQTKKEDAEYLRLDKEADRLEEDILNAETIQGRKQALAEKEFEMRGNVKKYGLDIDPDKEFRNLGEYLFAIRRFKSDGVRDSRLDELYEKREQTMGTGSTGGYALPEQFDPTLRKVMAQEGIVRSRAQVIPAGSPPDAKLSFPTLDQTSGQNMYGGVTLVHTGEGVTMTETTANLREISLEPKEISAYIVVTNKLLNNWEASGTFLSNVLTSAMLGQEDYDFMRGDGVNKSLGFINCAASIGYPRAGAGAIAFTDVTGMMARILMRPGSGNYVWLASQTAIPQLAAMTDAGTHAVWLGSNADALGGAAGPMPSTLLGLPLIFADRLPGLGTKGDLSLVNLNYYMIKDGSPAAVASSEHILFLSNKTVFKIVWNVDAKPWLTEPIALEGSTSDTVSPFVVLGDA